MAAAGGAPAGGLAAGVHCFVNYGFDEIHERLLLVPVDGSDCAVACPLFRLVVETMDPSNPDFEGFRVQTQPGIFPLAIDANDVFSGLNGRSGCTWGSASR